MNELVKLAKGLISPTDVAVSGKLTPQAAERIISMVFKDDFLSKVQSVRMTKLKRQVSAIDAQNRQLVRIPQGQEPKDEQKPGVSQHGCWLEALDCQLYPELTLDFLRDNADNPELVKLVESQFNTVFTNDFVDLGFNGTAEEYKGDFLKLNKGWVQIARESKASGTSYVNFGYEAGWRKALRQIVKAGDQRYRKTSVLVMNLGDADEYAFELGGHVTGSALVADSPLRRFQGTQIVPHHGMPEGVVMFTPMKNLAFGLHTDIHRDREWHSRKRCLQYTFDMACDYGIVVKQAVVLAESKGEKAEAKE